MAGRQVACEDLVLQPRDHPQGECSGHNRAELGGFLGEGSHPVAEGEAKTRPVGQPHPPVADLDALVEERVEPLEVLDPRLGGVRGGQVQMDLHRVVRRQGKPGVRGQRREPKERRDAADPRCVGLNDSPVARVDQRHVLGHRGEHLTCRDRGIEGARQIGVADGIPRVQRLLDPHQVERLEFAAHPARPGAVPLLVGIHHERRIAQVFAQRRHPLQVGLPIRLAHFDFDAADARVQRRGGLLLDLRDRRLQEAAGGVVDLAGITVRANQFGQRQAGPAGFEVPQRDVERRYRLCCHTGAPDRGTGPQQRLVDAVDIGGVLSDRCLGDLRQVGVLRGSARALRVAEPHALEALFGGHLDEQQHGLGQRFLPAREHFGITDRGLQWQDDVGQLEVADPIRHATSVISTQLIIQVDNGRLQP